MNDMALTQRNSGSRFPEWWLSTAGLPAQNRRNIQVLEWKAQQKETVMAHSVQIMLRHNQTEQAAQEMLREKFFLTDAEAKEFMKKMASKDGREGD